MDLLLLKTIVLPITILNIIPWTKTLPLSNQPSPRMSIADWTNYNAFQPHGTGTYAFGYDVEDPETNNIQYRDEERYPNGTVVGSYGYLRPDGTVHIAHYVADEKGYRVKIETSPRGQLKPYGEPDFLVPQGSAMSPAMQSALRSKQVYKKQKVHEQRTRPIDKVSTSKSPGVKSYHSVNENHHFSSWSTDFDEPSEFDDKFLYKSSFEKPFDLYFNDW